ncbi:tetratricopeptide repeat protein, partial [Candidatus Aerophobetes bacterium]|nr:tetratricopeptide repeat protein [Candidatus Aerophobetes bacterium]
MRITRIGINAGLPREMPYLEKYGIIELERGQPGIEENADPEIDNAPYFFKMANYYGAKDQFEKATKYYQLAEKLNPANAWIHSSLGDIYLKMGDYTGAVEEYKRAIQLEPDIGWFYFTLGRVYEKEGKINLA